MKENDKCDESLSEFFRHLQLAREQLNNNHQAIRKARAFIIEQLKKLSFSIEKSIRPLILGLQRIFKELPPRTKEALILLGKHGWYFDLQMPLPSLWDLKDLLANGNIEEVENILIKHFEDQIDIIEKSIIDKFTERKKIITAAFNAHRRQEYELSIPVLFAQTDGICKEVVDQYLFMKIRGRRIPQTAFYVEQIAANKIMMAFLSPLAQTLPVNAAENERDEGFDELNRHMVLHGQSLDYGNKKNSLKAISLINYVSHVLDKKHSLNKGEVSF